MIELGKVQKLVVLRKTRVGAFINEKNIPEGQEDILLPNNQMQDGLEIGDEVDVFVYKDSEDRVIATRKKPLIELGQVALLKVVDTNKVGAFLDWGLEKDLFLPFKEQVVSVQRGQNCLVTLYVDKSNRLSATMDVKDLIIKESPYKENQRVKGFVYGIVPEFGVYVAVDYKYDAIIPNTELFQDLNYGDIVEGRIKHVRQNGRLELSLRKETVQQIDVDVNTILNKLSSNNGKLMINDNSNPEKIKLELNMSKAAFKRAVGRLYKERKIKITDTGIESV